MTYLLLSDNLPLWLLMPQMYQNTHIYDFSIQTTIQMVIYLFSFYGFAFGFTYLTEYKTYPNSTYTTFLSLGI